MCGENRSPPKDVFHHKGSPPRVRGKRFLKCLYYQKARITPACAGKTNIDADLALAAKDHPRVCGENFFLYFFACTGTGSPPRVRGKLTRWHSCRQSGRITPACAGKTLRKWRISVVDPSPQPRSSLTSRKADASIGSQRAPCAAPV